MAMWSPWGWLWWWGGLTFCVSASSNRQEQQQEHRHTGHCNSPFPYPLRPCDRQALPPDHSCPPTGTNSMPRRRRTQTSAVRSLTQSRGRLAANQAASGTYQHHWTPSKPPYTTDSPSGRLSSLQRPFLFLLVALRNTVLSGKRKRNRADKNIVVGRYACKVGFGSALVWQEAPEYALRTARSKARTNVDLVHLNCCSETEKPRGTV